MQPQASPQPRRVATLVLDRPAVREAPAVTRCRPTGRRSRAGGRTRTKLACGRG